MALDFPASPTVGQLFPSPPTAGLPVWKWDGTTWNVYTNQGSAAFSQYEFTATAGQTTFTGADINGNTLAYALGYVMVFVNGDRLNKADYTASNGTSIVFAVGRAVGDQVTVEALTVASIFNALTTTNNLSDLTSKASAQANLFIAPTRQVLTSGTSATYTTPANCLWIEVEMVGGGGGGLGSGTSGGAGTSGTASTFSTLSAGGGANAGGAGGTSSGGDVNLTGAQGSTGSTLANTQGQIGASSPFGGAGSGGGQSGAGGNAKANTGSGGGAGGLGASNVAAGISGSAGGYLKKIITSPAATYTYTVGAAGTGGAAGTSGFASGAGGSGLIIVTEHYGS